MKQKLYGLVVGYQDTKYGWDEVYSIYVWAQNDEEAEKKIEEIYKKEQVADITGCLFEELPTNINPIMTDDNLEYVERSI